MSDPSNSTDYAKSREGRWKTAVQWIDSRTGLGAALRWCAGRPVPDGVGWRNAWASMIAFTFVVQVITGFFLWMFYSPSARTAWESLYYLQNEVTGGWLLRGVHHYAAQLLVALAGLYVVHLVLSGLCRAPRECVYWAAVLMLFVALGSCLTGDLLAWDQNSYASTQVRVRFLLILPWIGDDLYKLAAGGPAFGHLTLTRFLALHIGLCAASFFGLLLLHGWLLRRAASAEAGQPAAAGPVYSWLGSTARRCLPNAWCEKLTAKRPDARYWPDQLVRNAGAWLAVMIVVGLFVGGHGGVPLGAPADPDPANFYAAARPEWSFRGLYQLSNLFPGDPIPALGLSWKIVPIFVLPALLVVLILSFPFLGRLRRGYWINVLVLGFLAAAVVVLSIASWVHDSRSADYRSALAEGQQQAERVKALVRGRGGIPPSGALSLLRNDPKTEGPRIAEKHCAVCHNYSAPEGKEIATEAPSAPELFGFAGRQWLAEFLDPDKIKGPDYYGNTKFAGGIMVRYVQTRFSKLKPEEQTAIIAALSAESRLAWQHGQDAGDQKLIEKGGKLIVDRRCTRCHRFHDEGALGHAPDLTGYGSQEWIMGVVVDPAHDWFYGVRNDRMPAYLEVPGEPEENRLTAGQVQLAADWLRGQWYEPPESGPEGQGAAATRPKGKPAMLTVAVWAARRAEPAPVPDTPEAQARALYKREHCVICHGYTGGQGDDIPSPEPSAPDLGGFASRKWLTGLLDAEQVAGPKYFGNSAFAEDRMARFVQRNLRELVKELGEEELAKLIAALAGEAKRDAPADSKEITDETKFLFEDFTCTECHRFYDLGKLGTAPDLTGYGSREWIIGILSDPAQERFYRDDNDGMPSYHMPGDDPQKNLLTSDELGLLADWLRQAE